MIPPIASRCLRKVQSCKPNLLYWNHHQSCVVETMLMLQVDFILGVYRALCVLAGLFLYIVFTRIMQPSLFSWEPSESVRHFCIHIAPESVSFRL